MSTQKNKLTITVGIPTCYGGESLVATAKSIYSSIGAYPDAFIVCADRTPIVPEIRKTLEAMGITIIWNSIEGSQSKKIKQLLEQATTDLFVCTQDDVMFDPYALQEIVEAFQDERTTMLGIRILPLRPVTFFESSIASMLRIVNTIGRYWNSGDNYLLASGRCLVFRTEFLKRGRIFEHIVNGDMFFYLENKALGGIFSYQHNAKLYIRCPQHMKDQVGPSSRYQYSQEELQQYFSFDISREYRMPIQAVLVGIIKEFFSHPIALMGYIASFLYTRLKRQPKSIVSNTMWNVDSSTKG